MVRIALIKKDKDTRRVEAAILSQYGLHVDTYNCPESFLATANHRTSTDCIVSGCVFETYLFDTRFLIDQVAKWESPVPIVILSGMTHWKDRYPDVFAFVEAPSRNLAEVIIAALNSTQASVES